MGAPKCPNCGSTDTHVQAFGRKKYFCENEDCSTGEFGPEHTPVG